MNRLRVMKAIRQMCWLAGLLGACAFAQPKQEATISVNLESGALIKGTVKVVARVQSGALVERVEFTVDGALREVDESTPYEYEWDTVADTEGERTLKITAFLEGGKSTSKELRLTIDNGVAQGAPYHFQQARAAFAEGKLEDALYHTRVALKADSAHRESRVLQIQTLLRLGRASEADDAVEDLARLYPDSMETQELRVAASLRRAKNARNERELLRTAIDAQHKINQMRLKALGDSRAPDAIVNRTLLLIAEGEAGATINNLLTLLEREPSNTRYLNLLAYAYLSAGRLRDVLVITSTAIRRGAANDYTYAIRGLAAGLLNDSREQERAFTEAEKVEKNSRALLAAQANLAMLSRRAATAGRLAAQAQGLSDNSPQVAFARYWSFVNNREYDRAKDAFWRVLDLDPLMAEAYQLRGMLNLMDGLRPGDEDLLVAAREWFEIALQARPNYAPAHLGIAMSYAFEAYTTKRDGNRPSAEVLQKAEEVLNKALATSRDTAWAQVGASYVYTELRKVREADQAIRRAAQLDPERVTSLTPPEPARALELLMALLFVPVYPAP
ncbi:MAG: Ig-like domain-containing protein [Fimbriimonadales bacterium]|nr:Ig-like domain-containing protein [Fimbriimonadales bacterium]